MFEELIPAILQEMSINRAMEAVTLLFFVVLVGAVVGIGGSVAHCVFSLEKGESIRGVFADYCLLALIGVVMASVLLFSHLVEDQGRAAKAVLEAIENRQETVSQHWLVSDKVVVTTTVFGRSQLDEPTYYRAVIDGHTYNSIVATRERLKMTQDVDINAGGWEK